MQYSIIIPCYNISAFVNRAIDSALGQTRQDYEVILIDDGSTDGTADIIRTYSQNHSQRVRCVYQENKGPAAARNAGIRAASGEYMLFLDADDQLIPDALNVLDQVVTSQSYRYDFVYAGNYAVDSFGKIKTLSPKPKIIHNDHDFKRLLSGKGVSPTPGSIMVHKNCFQTLSYPVSIQSNEDFILFAHLFALYSGRSIPDPIVYKYKRPGSLRSNQQAIEDALGKAPDLLFDPSILPGKLFKHKPLYRSKRYLEKARIHFKNQEYAEFRKSFHQAVRVHPISAFDLQYIFRYFRSICLQLWIIFK